MALIAILLSILIERFLGSLEEMRRFNWFDALLAWVRGFSWSDGAGGTAVAVGVPVLAVMLAAHLLNALWWPLAFLFALLVLIYSLGPKDLEAQVEAFLDARERGDDESAWLHARDLLGDAEVTNARELTRAMVEAVLVEANERFLGVFFWFVVLGPAGALLYRLSYQLSCGVDGDSDFAVAARRLHYLLVAGTPHRPLLRAERQLRRRHASLASARDQMAGGGTHHPRRQRFRRVAFPA